MLENPNWLEDFPCHGTIFVIGILMTKLCKIKSNNEVGSNYTSFPINATNFNKKIKNKKNSKSV